MALCCCGVVREEREDALFSIEGIHVSSVTTTGAGLLLRVETGETVSGCPECGVVVGHGRCQARLHDIPCFGRPVRLLWSKRVWQCPDLGCRAATSTPVVCTHRQGFFRR